LGTKDDSVSCRWVFENVVDVLTKLRIVDESWTIWLLILGQKCLNFALMELNVECSKACTELNFEKMKRSEYGSKLYDKCSVP
jgi:LPS sulfotransferase NodH